MGDKEILAEYKIAYTQLEDILDNAEKEQVPTEERIKLIQTMNNLEFLYGKLYDRIEEQKDSSLYYEENVLVAPDIYDDYVDDDDDYAISAGDLDWRKWWEDYDFLEKV